MAKKTDQQTPKSQPAPAAQQPSLVSPAQQQPAPAGAPAQATQPGQQAPAGQQTAEGQQQPQQEQIQVNYSVSGGLRARLEQLGVSIVFTSYQSGLVYLIGRRPEGGISIHHTRVPKPMGVCADESVGGFMLAGDYQIYRFANVLDGNERANEAFDACYVPRQTWLTGRLDSHDIGIDGDGRPLFVNTRYNCLATVAPRYSFQSVWQPPFITDLIDEDRCHLNGLAMEDGKPRYVTVVSRSNTIDGWRDRRETGGAVVDVQSGEIVCDGLSMPHSPRIHDGKLWILNSGTGDLGFVHLKGRSKGKFESIAFCPGFVRGLAFRGGFAFVGLSKPRYQRFEGLELEDRLKQADSEPWCGVQIIELSSRTCVDWLRIDGQIAELYDVDILSGPACPMAVSADSSEAAQLTKFRPMDPPAGDSADSNA